MRIGANIMLEGLIIPQKYLVQKRKNFTTKDWKNGFLSTNFQILRVVKLLLNSFISDKFTSKLENQKGVHQNCPNRSQDQKLNQNHSNVSNNLPRNSKNLRLKNC